MKLYIITTVTIANVDKQVGGYKITKKIYDLGKYRTVLENMFQNRTQ